ncbi:MAG: J domain-containing protein [Planctomycetaceae bacterium]
MADNEHYNTLGVPRNAAPDQIRAAYKKLARKYHPDANPDDAAAARKFKEIQEAHSVLSDPQQRQQYDQFGKSFKQAGAGGQFHWPDGGAGGADLNDLLGGMFGGGGFSGGFGGGPARQRPRAAKGQNLKAEIEIPFAIAAEGGNHELRIRHGKSMDTLNITIPAGVDQGSVIRLSGQGHDGVHGGPPGDILVTVTCHPHPYFRRDANHLLLDLPITVSEAALGAQVEVPTLSEGPVVVTVPAGTSSGTKLRLRGKGVPDQKTGQRGDQFVMVKIVVPKHMDDQSRRLFEELADVDTEQPRDGLW